LRNEDTLYILTTEDAQNVAEETIGRKLTEKELENVKEYFDKKGYPGWYEEMEDIISEVTENNKA
jgi:hypothetical protein